MASWPQSKAHANKRRTRIAIENVRTFEDLINGDGGVGMLERGRALRRQRPVDVEAVFGDVKRK